MRTINFHCEGASAVLTVWSNGNASLSNVFSRWPGMGHGGRLMESIVQYADDNDMSIILDAKPYYYSHGEGLEIDDLRAFYEKYGFQVLNPAKDVQTMLRRAPSTR